MTADQITVILMWVAFLVGIAVGPRIREWQKRRNRDS